MPSHRTRHPALKLSPSTSESGLTRTEVASPYLNRGETEAGTADEVRSGMNLSWPGSAESGDHLTPNPHVRLVPPSSAPFSGSPMPAPRSPERDSLGPRALSTWHSLPGRRAQQRQPEPQHEEPWQRTQQCGNHGARPAAAAV